MVHVSTQSKLESLLKHAFEAVRARPLYGVGVCMLLLVLPCVLGVWGLSRVLHYGEVLTEGSFAQVKDDPRVYEVYLGSA